MWEGRARTLHDMQNARPASGLASCTQSQLISAMAPRSSGLGQHMACACPDPACGPTTSVGLGNKGWRKTLSGDIYYPIQKK